MKGQVLGFDGASGAITGEDGKRYGFTAADWKSDAPARARDAVDFVPAGTTATEIYATPGFFSRPAAAPMGDALEGDGAARARGYLALRPQVLIEGALILFALLFNFMGSGGRGVSLFDAGGAIGGMRAAMAAAGQIGSAITGVGATPPAMLTVLEVVGYLLWLIPIGAGYLLYREYRNARAVGLEMVVGIAAVASPVYILLVKSTFTSMMQNLGLPFPYNAGALVSFGLGAILILLCGLGLFATATGRLVRTPGL